LVDAKVSRGLFFSGPPRPLCPSPYSARQCGLISFAPLFDRLRPIAVSFLDGAPFFQVPRLFFPRRSFVLSSWLWLKVFPFHCPKSGRFYFPCASPMRVCLSFSRFFGAVYEDPLPCSTEIFTPYWCREGLFSHPLVFFFGAGLVLTISTVCCLFFPIDSPFHVQAFLTFFVPSSFCSPILCLLCMFVVFVSLRRPLEVSSPRPRPISLFREQTIFIDFFPLFSP